MSAYIWVKYENGKFIESATDNKNLTDKTTQALINELSATPFMIKITKTNDVPSDTVVSLGSNNFKLELDALQNSIQKSDTMLMDEKFFESMPIVSTDENIDSKNAVTSDVNTATTENNNNSTNNSVDNNAVTSDDNNAVTSDDNNAVTSDDTNAVTSDVITTTENNNNSTNNSVDNNAVTSDDTNAVTSVFNLPKKGGAPRTKKHRKRHNRKNTHRNYFIFKPRA